MNLLSLQNSECSSKSLKFPNDNDKINEKIWSLKKSRPEYVSPMARVINKLTEHINLNSDKTEM